MEEIKLFAKNEKESEPPNADSENIQSGHKDGIWHRKMLHTNNNKHERHIMEGIEPPNQEKFRMFGEKETYRYLGILESDTIKREEMKE